VGLGEAGLVLEESETAFDPPEEFLRSLPWDELLRDDKRLVTRARWMVHANYPTLFGLLPS
jgi:hypothetical protein